MKTGGAIFESGDIYGIHLGSYSSGFSAGVLAGGVAPGGPLGSLSAPWAVSPVWFEVAAVGVEAFAELTAPVAGPPSGPQA